MDEEIPGVEIAMVQDARLAVEPARELAEVPSERREVALGHRVRATLEQPPFDEVLDLPVVEPLVARLLKGDTARVAPARSLDLQQHEPIDRELEEPQDLGIILALHGIPERRVRRRPRQQERLPPTLEMDVRTATPIPARSCGR